MTRRAAAGAWSGFQQSSKPGHPMLTTLVIEYLTTHAGVDKAKFDDPNLMVEGLGLDSLGLVEMLFEVEDRFGFQIPDPMRFQAMSFKDMVEAMEASVREHSSNKVAQAAVGSAAAAE
jgi:acyl carrier protein